MGYFQHQHANWQDYVWRADAERTCEWCGEKFFPYSPNQRRHSYQHLEDEGNSCAWEYELENMGSRAYLKHVGMTKKEYIKEYGIEQYKLVVF